MSSVRVDERVGRVPGWSQATNVEAHPPAPPGPEAGPSSASGSDAGRLASAKLTPTIREPGAGMEPRLPEPPTTIQITAQARAAGVNEFVTAGGTLIAAKLNCEYNPITTNRTVIPRDLELYQYLTNFDGGWTRNVENMDHAKVKDGLLAWAMKPTSAQVLRRLGITNLEHLTPQQIALLSAQVAEDLIEYNRAAYVVDAGGSLTPDAARLGMEIDQWGVDEFFKPNHDGVCRTYAEITQGLFIVLKEMQKPQADSLLNNTYMHTPASHNHQWNAIYTVQPNGEVVVTQVDATWNDASVAGETQTVDYTFGDDNVRDYFRMKQLLEQTGKRELRELFAKFDSGNNAETSVWDWVWMRRPPTADDKLIGMREVNQAGGVAALSATIDGLPDPLRVDVWMAMNAEARDALSSFRKDKGLSAVPTKAPDHN
jgi:hypothetical protein